jgi:hypothetical protein
MVLDEMQIEFFKKVAQDQYSLLIREDYGEDGFEKLTLLTDAIAEIYRHLNFSSFTRIVIYTVFDEDEALSLENTENSNYVVYQSFQNLAQINGTELTIEVRGNFDLLVSVDFIPSVDTLRENAIVYQRNQAVETILGKTEQKPLRQIPNAESYFSVQTYKELDAALEDYKVKVARYSDNCPQLATVWFDLNKIFFKPKPEHTMRDSLTYFLQIRLRGSEVRPEQVVDKSHPVDIKVTWNLTNKLALIEIKWLGKSLNQFGKRFKGIYTVGQALEGAKQLADYLDANKVQAPDRITKGYLVVFDGRRWGANSSTQEISKKKGFHFENNEIDYNPDYYKTRSDFAKPVRFFMEPKCII